MKNIIKNFFKELSYYQKYRKTLKELKTEKYNNSELERQIDNLEFELDKDFQAKKIHNQEIVEKSNLETIHKLRGQIIELKSKEIK